MLSDTAKSTSTWIIGGRSLRVMPYVRPPLTSVLGSIPERDETDGRLYNTATVFNPQGDDNSTNKIGPYLNI